MPLNNPSAGDSTPKTVPLPRKTVRQIPSAIFQYQRTPTGVSDRNVTKRSETRRPKRCTSPFHASCSCPSIVDAVKEDPTTSFVASLRNYTPTAKKTWSARKRPQSPFTSECALVVAVRMRPFNTMELEDPNIASIIDMDLKESVVRIQNTNNEVYNNSIFNFDYVFNGINDQENVYNSVGKKVLNYALEGYNACLFAYGQTGSGKTYSIVGTNESPGVIPRFGKELFDFASKNDNVVIELSYFEIYKENIHDLLSLDFKKPLKIRENRDTGPFVANLSVFTVDSNEDFQSFIALGNTRRVTGSNGVNERSSRAHGICTIRIVQNKLDNKDPNENGNGTVLNSKVNIIDLAGSERASVVNSSGEQLKESVAINQSLLTLRKVITRLAERSSQRSKSIHIPYRESTLTFLLSDSLGCNSRTFMLATISPSITNIDETMSTLRYACQSRKIVSFVKINEDPNAVQIRKLLNEISRLKDQQKEFEAWKSEKTKLEEKRQLIMKYEIELEDLKRMLEDAKKQLDEKDQGSLDVQSRCTAEKYQQTNGKITPQTKSVEVNTSLVGFGSSNSPANCSKQLFQNGESESSTQFYNQQSSESGEVSDNKWAFTSEWSTVIQNSSNLQFTQKSDEDKCLSKSSDQMSTNETSEAPDSNKASNNELATQSPSPTVLPENVQSFNKITNESKTSKKSKKKNKKSTGTGKPDRVDESSSMETSPSLPISESLQTLQNTEINSLESLKKSSPGSKLSNSDTFNVYEVDEGWSSAKESPCNKNLDNLRTFEGSVSNKWSEETWSLENGKSTSEVCNQINTVKHSSTDTDGTEVDDGMRSTSCPNFQSWDDLQNENQAEKNTALNQIFPDFMKSSDSGLNEAIDELTSNKWSPNNAQSNDWQFTDSQIFLNAHGKLWSQNEQISTSPFNGFIQNNNLPIFESLKSPEEVMKLNSCETNANKENSEIKNKNKKSSNSNVKGQKSNKVSESSSNSGSPSTMFIKTNKKSRNRNAEKVIENETNSTSDYQVLDTVSDVPTDPVSKNSCITEEDKSVEKNKAHHVSLTFKYNVSPNKKITETNSDIKMATNSIADSYGVFILGKDGLRIVPNLNAETVVNGSSISGPALLSDGDRLVFGGKQHFRVSLQKKTKEREKSKATITKKESVENEKIIKTRNPLLDIENRPKKTDFLNRINAMFSHLWDESFDD